MGRGAERMSRGAGRMGRRAGRMGKVLTVQMCYSGVLAIRKLIKLLIDNYSRQ